MYSTCRMKTARVVIDAISITCPHCSEYQPNQTNGSFMHTDENRDELVTISVARTCSSCRLEFKLPKIVEKLGVTA